MTRLALPAILVIGAFSSAALAAPVSASPWSSTGTPTPLPEHNVASSQAHHVSSRDVHSRELTTRGLAISRLLGANTQNNPTTTDSEHPRPSGLVGLHGLRDNEFAMVNESRRQRGVPELQESESLDALNVDDWQVLVEYYEKDIKESDERIQRLPHITDPVRREWMEYSLYGQKSGDEQDLGWAKRRMALAKERAASANTVPKKH
ncbi:hypothetical protein FB446DRAFT_706603 [Lentinula raphanica]|nr:hypothetical protein FB446DRAFT_706603 [Lentinula raphanica]